MKPKNPTRTGSVAAAGRRQRGVSLIEVMVAMFVLAFGLLGMAGLQLAGMRANQGALLRTQATLLASDMAERIRAGLFYADAGDLDLAVTTATSSIPETEGGIVLQDWRLRVQATLPNGRSSVARDSIGGDASDVRYIIRVIWDDTRAGGTKDQSVELIVRPFSGKYQGS